MSPARREQVWYELSQHKNCNFPDVTQITMSASCILSDSWVSCVVAQGTNASLFPQSMSRRGEFEWIYNCNWIIHIIIIAIVNELFIFHMQVYACWQLIIYIGSNELQLCAELSHSCVQQWGVNSIEWNCFWRIHNFMNTFTSKFLGSDDTNTIFILTQLQSFRHDKLPDITLWRLLYIFAASL